MKRIIPVFFLVMLVYAAFPVAASAEIYYDGKDTGSVYNGDPAGLEGAPYFPSVMATLDLGVLRNGMVYTGNNATVRFKAPFGMYVNILDFSPDGYVTLLTHNFYTEQGSNVLNWRVEGTVTGSAGREYLYLIISTQSLDYDYLEKISSDPKGYKPEDYIYATDIQSFQVLQGAGGTSMQEYSPFVPIQGTPLEVYPTYYIFPADRYYNYPYFYYYYYLPEGYPGGGKYYRTRVRIGSHSYYAYPNGGIVQYNLAGLHSTGDVVIDHWNVIPGGSIDGTFKLDVISSPLGLVIHPYLQGGFYRSFKEWGNDFTFEVWVNGQSAGHGYVVNDDNGQPTFYAPLASSELKQGDNTFEIRVPGNAKAAEIERIEVVEASEPEQVDAKQAQQFPNPAGVK